jgi:glutamine amidotransferase
MIGILNYGLGNVKAFANIYKILNMKYKFVSKIEDFKDVTKIILPGVGAFDYAMERLNKSGLREKLDEYVLEKKIPVLGICVGLQMLAEKSEEGKLEGLKYIPGEVKKFNINFPLPHMGWNEIIPIKNNKLLKNLNKPKFYFLHSYYFESNEEYVLAKSEYVIKFNCILNKDNIYGIQCHPEKSHHFGIKLLKNFGEL